MTPDEGRRNDAEQIEDFDWALDRVQRMCASAYLDAQVYGKRLLKGCGYPNESFSRAQDARALSILLNKVTGALSPAGRRPPESSDVRHRLQLAEDAIAAQMRSEEHYASCAVCGAFREEHPELCPVGRRFRNEVLLLREAFLGSESAMEAVRPPAAVVNLKPWVGALRRITNSALFEERAEIILRNLLAETAGQDTRDAS